MNPLDLLPRARYDKTGPFYRKTSWNKFKKSKQSNPGHAKNYSPIKTKERK